MLFILLVCTYVCFLQTCVRFPELFEAVRKEDLDLSKSVRTEYFQYLLQHFFHPMLKDFHPVNVQFFLQLINMDYEGYTLPLLKECLIRIMRTKVLLTLRNICMYCSFIHNNSPTITFNHSGNISH